MSINNKIIAGVTLTMGPPQHRPLPPQHRPLPQPPVSKSKKLPKNQHKAQRKHQAAAPSQAAATSLDPPVAANEWQEAKSPEGYTYYWNSRTAGISSSCKIVLSI